MSRLLAVGVILCAVACSAGCYVASVAPFCSDDTTTFEAALLGTWAGEGGNDTWTFTRAEEPAGAYSLELLESPSFFQPASGKRASNVSSWFTVRLFKLDSTLFLDGFPAYRDPRSPADTTGFRPGPSWSALRPGTHFLARMELRGQELRLAALDADKLDRLLHSESPGSSTPADRRISPPALLSHLHMEDTGETWERSGGPSGANLLLTGSTTELQTFLRRHLKDQIFEDEGGVMRRQR